jgi:APA family basic amino acid/polyamine antiporter
MSSPEIQSSQGTLKKELGLIVLIFLMIGLNVGGSLFSLTSIAAKQTGPSLFIAQIIAALPVLLALIPYMILTSSVPKTAASYQYAKNFSYPLAVAGVLVMLVAVPMGGLPFFAITNAEYFLQLVPLGTGVDILGFSLTWVQIVAILTVVLFYIVNIRGIKLVGQIEFIMTGFLLLAMALFAFVGLPSVKIENFSPLFTGGALGIVVAAALSYTLLAGGLFGIELGDEVKDARKTIPRALVISVFVVLVLYILIEIVAVGVVDWKTFAAGKLFTPARVFMPEWMYLFFIFGGIMACVTTVHALMAIAGRYTMKFAEDGFFPPILKRINRRYGTPVWGLTLPFVLTTLTIIFIKDTAVLAAMLNFGLLFLVSLVLLFAYNLPKKHPEIFAQSRYKFTPVVLRVTALSAAILNIFFMLLLCYMILFQSKQQWAVGLFVIAIVAGIILYFVRKKMGLVKKPEL